MTVGQRMRKLWVLQLEWPQADLGWERQTRDHWFRNEKTPKAGGKGGGQAARCSGPRGQEAQAQAQDVVALKGFMVTGVWTSP